VIENGYQILNKLNKKYCTRETSHKKTILDHVLTKEQHNFHMTIVESAISDHNHIYLELEQKKPIPLQKKQYAAVNYQKLKQDLTNMKYTVYGYDDLKKWIQTAITKNKTIKTKILNTPKRDWINKDILIKINKRNRLWKLSKEKPEDLDVQQQFKEERNRTSEYIQTTKMSIILRALKIVRANL
jgi:hypothetical protein